MSETARYHSTRIFDALDGLIAKRNKVVTEKVMPMIPVAFRAIRKGGIDGSIPMSFVKDVYRSWHMWATGHITRRELVSDGAYLMKFYGVIE